MPADVQLDAVEGPGDWSNGGFSTSTGYPNSKGQHACLDGGNYK